MYRLQWSHETNLLVFGETHNGSLSLPLTWPSGGALTPGDRGMYRCAVTYYNPPAYTQNITVRGSQTVELHVSGESNETCDGDDFFDFLYFCTVSFLLQAQSLVEAQSLL